MSVRDYAESRSDVSEDSDYIFSTLPSEQDLKQLIEHGLDVSKALQLILNVPSNKYDSINYKFVADQDTRFCRKFFGGSSLVRFFELI